MVRPAAAHAVLPAVMVLLIVVGCATGTDAVTRGGTFEFVSPGGQTRIFYSEAERKRDGVGVPGLGARAAA